MSSNCIECIKDYYYDEHSDNCKSCLDECSVCDNNSQTICKDTCKFSEELKNLCP